MEKRERRKGLRDSGTIDISIGNPGKKGCPDPRSVVNTGTLDIDDGKCLYPFRDA